MVVRASQTSKLRTCIPVLINGLNGVIPIHPLENRHNPSVNSDYLGTDQTDVVGNVQQITGADDGGNDVGNRQNE